MDDSQLVRDERVRREVPPAMPATRAIEGRFRFTSLRFGAGAFGEMLVVETVVRIRREFYVEGKSIEEPGRVAEHGEEGSAVGRDRVLV